LLGLFFQEEGRCTCGEGCEGEFPAGFVEADVEEELSWPVLSMQ